MPQQLFTAKLIFINRLISYSLCHCPVNAQISLDGVSAASPSLDGVSAAKSNLAASLTKRSVAETAKVLGQGIIAGGFL